MLTVCTTMYSLLVLGVLSIICVKAGQVETMVTMAAKNVTGCDPLPLTNHMELIPSLAKYPLNFTLTISCVNSSVLVGDSSVVCLETGNWSVTNSHCKQLDCKLPEIPANGIRQFQEGSEISELIVKYSCNERYELLGKTTSRCQPDGNWTEPVPTCSRTCVPAMVPLNGSVHMECSYHNCTALFMCHEGYTLVGDKMSLCLEGVWVHEHIPKCQKTYCTAPPQVNNSLSTINFSQESFPYGASVTYSCLFNFTLYGNNTLRCGMHGQWLGQVPYCMEVQSTTTEVTTDLSTLSSPPPTQGITTADTPVGSDKNSTCTLPPSLQNGQYLLYDANTLLYKCDYGYTLQGAKQRVCQENMTWSHESPTCGPDASSNETTTPDSVHMAKVWREVFLQYTEWEGTYVYWEKATRFKMWVLGNIHPNGEHLEVLFLDNQEAQLHVIVSYEGTSLKFEMTHLIDRSERFLPDHKWAFEGFLRKHHNHWQFIATTFHSDPGFEKLRMSPKRDYSPPPIPHFTEPEVGGEPSLKVIALALGVVIAVVAILLAAALAAFLVRRKAMKAGGHRSVTSFENPVYDYQNSLKLSEQYQEQYQEPTDC